MDTSFEYAASLDTQDPLSKYRQRFEFPEADLIYMDGNSLGRLPSETIPLADDLVQNQWGQRLIRGWGDGWWRKPFDVGAKIASLIGAQPDEVIVSDSTSINLYKLALGALQAQAGRHLIHTDNLNFPSDLYILQGIRDLLGQGHEIRISQSPDAISGPVEELSSALSSNSALLTLSHTVFKSGYTYDMESLTQAAHNNGAMVLWDLSHSVGALPIDLNAANVDLAIGCTYKYLNGGPGAPAFLYVRRDLQEKIGNPITGWWGQDQPFDFGLEFNPIAGMQKYQSGTLPMISLALIEPGLDMFLEIGMEAIRTKSERQSNYFIELWEELLAPIGYTLNSPRDVAMRGSHISLGHPEGWRISQCMIQEMDIIPDFREPDNIRLGIAPLYTRYIDIFNTVIRMQKIVSEQLYENYSQKRTTVT
jgi:kynureninase